MKWILLLPTLILFMFNKSCAQNDKNKPLTRQDTLRGSINAERDWWNVEHYNLAMTPDIVNKTIAGSNTIHFKVAKLPTKAIMQIDLQEPLQIDKIVLSPNQKIMETTRFIMDPTKVLNFKREGNVYHVDCGDWQFAKDMSYQLIISYKGKPVEAVRPPWDGGLIWKKDKQGNPWVAVACQGLGASVWYPCKDHQSDEPDSMLLSITTPDTLMDVSNGRLRAAIKNDNRTITWVWAIVNPINNYNATINIGKYAHFKDTLKGEKGILDCDYYVLQYNETKAKKHFVQCKDMLRCFEYWFGPYPFYEDGYKLVEAPYLGMEHQSATAYGNGYMNGYAGQDYSGSGWGMKWDFMIVHESGHDWWGNNITTNDIADMWVHEGITNYSETIYTGWQSGKQAGNEYCQGDRKNIQNDEPIISAYGVNREGSGDMYYKGGNMIHTIRQIMNNDEKFRQMLRGMQKTFYHQTVNSKQIENYIIQFNNMPELKWVFDQYLRTVNIPSLEYYLSGTNNATLNVRFVNCVSGFKMKIDLPTGKSPNLQMWVTDKWQKIPTKWKANSDIQKLFNANYYVNYERVR